MGGVGGGLLLAACNDADLTDGTLDAGKTPIALTVGGVDSPAPTSRAVITTGGDKTMKNFDVNTKIFMVMKSECDKTVCVPEADAYKGTRADALYTVCRGDLTKDATVVTFDATNQKYWDDIHGRSSQLTIWAYAQKGQSWTECSFATEKAGSGSSAMEKYEKVKYETTNARNWESTAVYPAIYEWRASHETYDIQTETSVMCQDLLFSNNLANNSDQSGSDGRLKFDFGTRKFPTGDACQLKFYHAMSKITIKLIEGEGFDKTSANKTKDFQFATNENIKLKNVNKLGLFNIKTGIFESVPQPITSPTGTNQDNGEVPKIWLSNTNPDATGGNPYYTLQALVVPNINGTNGISDTRSRCKNNSTETMMEFTIDDNLYQITSGTLYTALHGKEGATESAAGIIPFEAGKHYIFTFTINKKAIGNITAQVADWEEVTAEGQVPTNARIKLQLEERGSNIDQNADIYRATETLNEIGDSHTGEKWKTGYDEKNVFKYDASPSPKLTNDWFWLNNKTYHHFRAIMPSSATSHTTDAANGDYITLTDGPYSSANDVCWGAPMLDNGDNEDSGTFKWKYDINHGFDVQFDDTYDTPLKGKKQIYHAIGPTEDAVKLTLFHMTSQVTFKLTTNDAQTDAVTLGDGSNDDNKTKLEILDYNTSGTLRLGTGLVTPNDSKTPTNEIGRIYAGVNNNLLTYTFIPQDLTGVQLRITTPDHNQYLVNLADIYVTTAPDTNNLVNPYAETSTGRWTLGRWYPGFHYTYTLNLTKKKIDKITATVLGWETIEATYPDIQIQ